MDWENDMGMKVQYVDCKKLYWPANAIYVVREKVSKSDEKDFCLFLHCFTAPHVFSIKLFGFLRLRCSRSTGPHSTSDV